MDNRIRARHMLIAVLQEGSVLGYRLLDMRSEYAALTKELACRAVAASPDFAGASWMPQLRVDGTDTATPSVLLDAFIDDEKGGPGDSEAIAALRVPVSNFSALAADIATRLGVQGAYSYSVAVAEPDSQLVTEWNALAKDDDFELMSSTQTALVLPGGFSMAALPPRRVLDKADGWLRCVFGKSVLDEFLGAAALETDHERSWLGLGHVHLVPDACYVVIDEGLVELPGQAHRTGITTHGRDWARLYDAVGDRLVAYLHLHPPTAGDSELAPVPSTNDAVLAWNVDLASPRPTVFPIAMFGANVESPNGDIAVHGFERGLLTRIQLEVEE